MSVYSQQYEFGGGTLWGVPTGSNSGTPIKFGTLQDVQIDFSGDIKPLHGQYQYALALARGKTKIELKAKFAQVRGLLFNELYFGATLTATETIAIEGESDTVASTSYVVANGATFAEDLGVYYAATGQPLTATLSAAPAAAGFYKAGAAGVGKYLFNASDNAQVMLTDYTYTTMAGQKITITNPRMGNVPTFQCVFSQNFDGRNMDLTFNNVVAGKLSMPSKQDDWTINEMDMEASADASGVVAYLNSAL